MNQEDLAKAVESIVTWVVIGTAILLPLAAVVVLIHFAIKFW